MADRRGLVDDPLAGVRFPERYDIERVIGRGGTGVVFAAYDRRLRRRVAVKVLAVDASVTEERMLQHEEARVLASLAHPNLIGVHDAFLSVGPSGPAPMLVLELVDGPDLAQHLRASRLTVDQVAQVGEQLCAALAYVHERGYLHQDVKPSNVLLHFDRSGAITAKLSDFGTAVLLRRQGDQGEFTIGTAAYLSPEQAEGVTLTPASDVYALGLVLLEAATQDVAFPGPLVEAALARLDRDPVVPDSLPAALREVLGGMLHRDPARRLDLAAALPAFRRLRSEEGDDSDSRAAAAPEGADRAEAPLGAALDRTAEFFRPQELELTRLLELGDRIFDGAGAALLEREGSRYRNRADHNLPELATLDLRTLLLTAATGGPTEVHDADDSVFLTAQVAPTADQPARFLVIRLPHDRQAVTAAMRGLLEQLASTVEAALQLRDSFRRALFAR